MLKGKTRLVIFCLLALLLGALPLLAAACGDDEEEKTPGGKQGEWPLALASR